MTESSVTYIGAVITILANGNVVSGLLGIVGAMIGAVTGALLAAWFTWNWKKAEEEKDADRERARLREKAATVLGVVWALMQDGHPRNITDAGKARRDEIARHWMDARNQVFALSAGYEDPQVRKHIQDLADAVEKYIRHSTREKPLPDPRYDSRTAAVQQYERAETVWNLIRTETQTENMLAPHPVEDEITEETRREKILEDDAKSLKVGDTALLLRSGLKVTLLGIYRGEQVPQAGSKPFALEEGEVYLVARVVVENLIKHPFEVDPRQNFELTGTHLSMGGMLGLGEHYPRGTLDLQWLRDVAGEARAGSWEGKIRRGEEREGFLAYKMQQDGKARLVFRTVGKQGTTVPYGGAKAHELVAVWHLGEVASLPTLPPAMEEEWIQGRREKRATIVSAIRKSLDEGNNPVESP
jgi:hypothetical protein